LGPIHVYCIAEDSGTLAIGPLGTSPLESPTKVAADGLACVIGPCPGADASPLPKDELVRRLLVHQRVVEHVMRARAVLPVKFGTVLRSSQEALDLLAQGRQQFLGALESLSDKVEIEVAATWDLDLALRETGAEEEVMRARQALSQPPTLEDKLRLGQVVKACLDRRRNSFRLRMVSLLQPLALGVVQHALLTDRLVMNVAFLLERAILLQFEERVRRLDAMFDGQITFRVIGPLPPYSFSTVEVTHIAQDELERARCLLGIGQGISEAEVRLAYRRASARLLRELDPRDRTVADRMAQVRRASDLLLAQARTDGGHCGEGRQSFAIRIRGAQEEDVDPARFGQAAPIVA